jgi:catechol 2,3-dioxygenase-like lactoylglutathione lyase family enzyme
MRIDRIDHLVLTVADIPRTIAFYVDVLGMTEEIVAELTAHGVPRGAFG